MNKKDSSGTAASQLGVARGALPDDEINSIREAEFRALVEEAGTALQSAWELMDQFEALWLSVAPGKTKDDFEKEVAEPMHEDEFDVDGMIVEYAEIEEVDSRDLGAWPLIEWPILIGFAHCVLARIAVEAKENDFAWKYVAKASYWHGLTIGLNRHAVNFREEQSIGNVTRKAAHVRNAENREIMKHAFEWLDANFASECKSFDHAAELLTKIVPVAFRTARRYVSKWNLSRLSARTE
jgi:hypothetical protein